MRTRVGISLIMVIVSFVSLSVPTITNAQYLTSTTYSTTATTTTTTNLSSATLSFVTSSNETYLTTYSTNIRYYQGMPISMLQTGCTTASVTVQGPAVVFDAVAGATVHIVYASTDFTDFYILNEAQTLAFLYSFMTHNLQSLCVPQDYVLERPNVRSLTENWVPPYTGRFSIYATFSEPTVPGVSIQISPDYATTLSASTSYSTTVSSWTNTITTETSVPVIIAQPAPWFYAGIGFFVCVVVAVLYVVVRFRRAKRPKNTEAKKVESETKEATSQETAAEPKVEPETEKAATTTSKRYCIECGNELSPNLKFCDSCGTKQP